MANKTTLTSQISTALTAIISIAKVNLAFSKVVNEVYSDAVTDDQTTQTYTTKSGTSIDYGLVIKKSGNGSHIKFKLKNNLPVALSASPTVPQAIFTWKTNEFQPKDGVDEIVIQCWISNSRISILLNSVGCYLISSMPTAIPGLPYHESSYEFYINKD